MRSHLTRTVFRRLLRNEPLHFPCRHHHGAPTLCCRDTGRRHAQPIQRRTIFGFASRPRNAPQQTTDIAAGYLELVALNKALRLKHRPAKPRDVATACSAFIASKFDRGLGFTDVDCAEMRGALAYLLQHRHEDELAFLDAEDVRHALLVINRNVPKVEHQQHARLAQELWDAAGPVLARPVASAELKAYCLIMAKTSNLQSATDLLSSLGDLQSTKAVPKPSDIWQKLAYLYPEDGDEAGYMRLIDHYKEDARMHGIDAVAFYARRNEVESTKAWAQKLLAHRSAASARVLRIILDFAQRNGQQEWCKDFFRQVINQHGSDLSKSQWDVLVLWAATRVENGVEEIEHMIQKLEEQSFGGTGSFKADTDTLNELIDYADTNKDPYLAERFIAMGLKRGIQPNKRTYILQIQYRTGAGDLSGAHQAYSALQSEELSDTSDLAAVNAYLRALCVSPTASYERILSILTDLSERGTLLQIDTVVAILKLYLQRNELDDVISILHAHISLFKTSQRSEAIALLLGHIHQASTTTEIAWDTYNIVRTMFPEIDVPARSAVVKEFFDRERADMAAHAFGHMRGHDLPEFRPTIATYVVAFEGLTACADREQLDVIHNMLKLDVNIEPNTQLYNSLMMAYTSVRRPSRALDFWDDITNSQEGPNYRSLEIVFHACGKLTYGHERAKQIWERLIKMDVEISKVVFAQYVGCLAGNLRLGDIGQILGDLSQRKLAMCDFKLDAEILGTIYNMVPASHHQDQFEAWAKHYYPKVWTDLQDFESYQDVPFATLDVVRLYRLPYKMRA